jgi:hypothetical protein
MEATLLEALQRAVAEVVGFRLEVRVVDEDGYTTATGVVEMARQTVLPCHEEEAACQETDQMLADFAKHDPERAIAIVADIGRALRWFERCEQDPGWVTREL